VFRAVTCTLAAATALIAASPAAAQAPVGFDRYSLQVGGERVFANGGEVHPYRIPAQTEWPRMLRKLRAAGLNEISIYIPWSLHEPAPGTFRWNGRFDLDRFLRDARDAGLYVVARPGPYIQGEIDGGGFPWWLLGRPGVVRTVDPNYTVAWKAWFAQVMPRIARWQVGGRNRGSVIAVQVENELPGDTEEARAYMRDLVATAKADGITVPVTHNDVQFLGAQLSRGLFVDIVDLFGFDNYPYGFQCCKEWNESTFEQVDQFEDYYRGKG
jgi:beta-galactosidase